MGRVSGKVAVVTSGASGIGEAMVRILAAHGAKVVIADLNTAQGGALADSVGREGGEAIFIPLDVTDEQQWDEVMKNPGPLRKAECSRQQCGDSPRRRYGYGVRSLEKSHRGQSGRHIPGNTRGHSYHTSLPGTGVDHQYLVHHGDGGGTHHRHLQRKQGRRSHE